MPDTEKLAKESRALFMKWISTITDSDIDKILGIDYVKPDPANPDNWHYTKEFLKPETPKGSCFHMRFDGKGLVCDFPSANNWIMPKETKFCPICSTPTLEKKSLEERLEYWLDHNNYASNKLNASALAQVAEKWAKETY